MRDTGFWPERLPQVEKRTAEFTYREGDTLKPGPSPVPKDHPLETGGAGLYSTAADYAKAIQAVLSPKVVKSETLDLLLTPQLNDAQKAALMAIAHMYRVAFCPEIPKGTELDWNLVGLVAMEDIPGKRRKGTVAWSGMANARWWADRETGIGAILLVNVLPHGDAVVESLINELELAVYGDLLPKP
jgi:CubicO group peptidase (beta-lactamase class C family)